MYYTINNWCCQVKYSVTFITLVTYNRYIYPLTAVLTNINTSMNISNIAYQGIVASRIGIQMTSQNIANANTPGYRRYATTFAERSGGGVSATPYRTGAEWMDVHRRNAIIQNNSANTFANAYADLSNAPFDDLRTAYVGLRNAQAQVTRDPTSAESQQAMQQATQAFQNSVNRFQHSINDFRYRIEKQLDLAQQRADQIQEQIDNAMTNGIADPEEIKNFQNQLITEQATISDLRTVLKDVIAPVEQMFQDAMQSPEFTEGLNLLEANIGYMQQDAETNAEYAAVRLQNAEANFGVDLVEEYTNMMKYERMYEANAKVLEISDRMVGSILNIVA